MKLSHEVRGLYHKVFKLDGVAPLKNTLFMLTPQLQKIYHLASTLLYIGITLFLILKKLRIGGQFVKISALLFCVTISTPTALARILTLGIQNQYKQL